MVVIIEETIDVMLELSSIMKGTYYGTFVQSLLKIHLKSITFQPVLSPINHSRSQTCGKRIVSRKPRQGSHWESPAYWLDLWCAKLTILFYCDILVNLTYQRSSSIFKPIRNCDMLTIVLNFPRENIALILVWYSSVRWHKLGVLSESEHNYSVCFDPVRICGNSKSVELNLESSGKILLIIYLGRDLK